MHSTVILKQSDFVQGRQGIYVDIVVLSHYHGMRAMPLAPEDIIKYKPLYVQTARAYLNDMQRNITLLLTNLDNADAYDVVHLAAHSLTSQSTMMGYTGISGYASVVEKLSNAHKEGTYKFSQEIIALIDQDIKKLQESLNAIEKDGHELDVAPLMHKLQEVTKLT